MYRPLPGRGIQWHLLCQYDTEGAGTEGRPGRTAHARDRPGYDLCALSELFGLKENQLYSYRELLQCAEKKLDKENFLKSCGRCRWYQQGLCSYEEWLENARKILNFLKEF